MSTRSGKRLHSSMHENMVTTELELPIKTEKKTRSKRLKENDAQLDTTVSKLKKRNNYVTYPTEEEPISEVDASERKNTRRKLRNTLKDHNITVTAIETTDSTEETKKSTRLTRRTKKFAENVEDLPDCSVVTEVEIPNVTLGTKSKKSKKKKKKSASNEIELQNGDVPAKKSKKKKKQKRSVNDENKINDSGMSIDSFHSAAGSPVTENVEIGKESQDCVAQSPETNVQKLNGTFEKNDSVTEPAMNNTDKKNSSIIQNLNGTYDKNTSIKSPIFNNTFDKETKNKRKSSIKNATFDKIEHISLTPNLNRKNYTFDKTEASEKLNSTFEVEPVTTRKSLRLNIEKKDSTFEKTPQKDKGSKPTSLNSTFDKETKKLDSTFDQTSSQKNSKSSLVSSDEGTINVTFDKSDENIRISITSDDSTENIVNTTPVLVESSIDESKISLSPQQSTETFTQVSEQPKPPVTPLKREGTFTKDGPDPIIIPTIPKISTDKTPTKRMSVASPGSTPFPIRSTQKTVLNVTRSIEKNRRSSLADAFPRQTRVMFCSPVNNPGFVTLEKKKVIKSSMKGSNKSFLFDDSVSTASKPAGRKRSFTHNDADDSRVKRKRLADDMQQSVDRLSRPRTCSATAKLDATTPTKKPATPYKRSESKPSRTKLPNFAALHQKEFDKMESLDECQERKAKRAKQLLTPTGAGSPRVATESKLKEHAKKNETPTKPRPETVFKPKLPTLESLRPGYTRFGFKMNCENNPFSIPSKVESKPKEIKPNGIKRNAIKPKPLPSLAGATSVRREIAKNTVLREKSFTSLSGKRDEKRKENRTVIKGVRTNRRFELQMRSRNMN